MPFHPAGLATGIGSLPFTDPEEALEVVLENVPFLPHWPQLPGRGKEEGFVFQFLHPLVKTGVLTVEEGRAYFNTGSPAWVEDLTEFYDLCLRAQEEAWEGESGPGALAEFAPPHGAAAGLWAFLETVGRRGPGEALYFKGQIAGPLTVGFALKDERGRPAYYDRQLRELLRTALALAARWQARALARLGRPAVVFIDDPAVNVYGQASFITVTREMIAEDLEEIVRAVHAEGGLAGVHSCDAVDWSIFFALGLDIVNLDAYSFGESLFPFAREAKEFLERGGVLAWGIVPTSGAAREEGVESLLGRLSGLWEELARRGVRRDLLRAQCLLTPACGTGLLEPDLARRIYRLTAGAAEEVRRGWGA